MREVCLSRNFGTKKVSIELLINIGLRIYRVLEGLDELRKDTVPMYINTNSVQYHVI